MQFAWRCCCKSLFPELNVTGVGLGSNKAAGVCVTANPNFCGKIDYISVHFSPSLYFHLFNLSGADNCSAAEGKHVNGSRGSNCDTVGGFVSVHSRMEHMTLQT